MANNIFRRFAIAGNVLVSLIESKNVQQNAS